MIFQYNALNGDSLPPTKVDRLIEDTMVSVLGNYNLPHGLIGVNTETGLAKIRLRRDKSTEMKLGKFLVKTGHTDEVVRDWSSLLKAAVEQVKGAKIEITTTGEEAVYVYRNGPTSCMKGSDSVAVYDGIDTAVAFVKIGDRIVARSVVVINKGLGLQYIKIYGNEDLLRPLLEKEGFKDGTLVGCSLGLIEDYNGTLCPYLDDGGYVDMCEGRLHVVDSGRYSATMESGYIDATNCEDCGGITCEDDLVYCDYSERRTCDACYGDNHTYVDDDWYHISDNTIVEAESGDYILSEESVEIEGLIYHQDDCVYSEYIDEDILISDAIEAVTSVEYPEDTETCIAADCIVANDGVQVHEDIIDKYNFELRQMSLALEA